MFTVETEDNHKKIVALDTNGEQEDIEIFIDRDGCVFIRQWTEDLQEYQVLFLSASQFWSLISITELEGKEGLFSIETDI